MDKTVSKKLDACNSKIKKISNDVDTKFKNLDYKLEDKFDTQEFKNQELITQGTLFKMGQDIKEFKLNLKGLQNEIQR